MNGHEPSDWKQNALRGVLSPGPIPTRIVSNEEFSPPPQTRNQARVEQVVTELNSRAAKRLGMTRRQFLKTTGGMAAALLAMNSVFGRFFDVFELELFEPAAFAEQQGVPFFIFDVQTHYVSSGYDLADTESRRRGAVAKDALLGLRRRAKESGLNPLLTGDRGTLDDLSWQNFVKEVFLDSETSIGLIST
ncbi:MAG TPA: twin-arginine translocation signal domain-containing protein, partial [Nitrospira sp.]|nr:twin-arginine translocation signal domain-containing protein [Nitrospira sp.]